MSNIDNFLEHYGVIGMKWGKRKGSSSSSSKSKRTNSSDHVESRSLKAKKNRELSTKELQSLNNRLQLEKTRKKLDPNAVNRGHDAARDILAVGTTVASLYALSQTPLGKQVTNSIKSAMSKG